MYTAILILLIVTLLSWKGYQAFQRGMRTWRRDRQDHQSLYEYLIANGGTPRQARRPFLRHAIKRALLPLLRQWRFMLIIAFLLLLLILHIR